MAWLLRISVDGVDHSPIDDELMASRLWDLGTNGIHQNGLGDTVAGFETRAEAEHAAAVLDDHPTTIEPATDPEVWDADNDPSTVAFDVDGRTVGLTINAAGAFGHGGHRTTRLALDLLVDSLKPDDHVLDIGTGTGVLAIAAAAAGAGSVVAMDNDPIAVRAATSNVAVNGDLMDGPIPVRVGLWTVDQAVSELGRPADVVVMNVLLPVHRRLAPAVVWALAPGGRLITAGYLDEQHDELLSIYQPLFKGRDVTVEARHCDGWAADLFAEVR